MSGQHKSAQTFETRNSEYNHHRFAILQVLKELHTAEIVQVREVFPRPPGDERRNRDGISGFVHAELAIEQVDNFGRRIEMRPIFNLPYFRLHGGLAALVLDPAPQDFGIALFCERDISTFKRTLAKCLPETNRMHSQSDGIYIGGILNQTPKVYIRLDAEKGIDIEATGDLPVNINCNKATIKATEYCHIDTPVQAEACMDIYIQPGRQTHPYPEFEP